jgi:hypothetical protein
VGLNLDGHPAAPFPYRWGLGGDLQPGASTTIVGLVKLTYDITATTFWAGVIQEPDNVLQDNQHPTLVTVLPANLAVVTVHLANVRSGPNLASSIVDGLTYGTQVPLLGQENDWYKIKLADGRVGYVAAGWIVAANGNALPTVALATAGPPTTGSPLKSSSPSPTVPTPTPRR